MIDIVFVLGFDSGCLLSWVTEFCQDVAMVLYLLLVRFTITIHDGLLFMPKSFYK